MVHKAVLRTGLIQRSPEPGTRTSRPELATEQTNGAALGIFPQELQAAPLRASTSDYCVQASQSKDRFGAKGSFELNRIFLNMQNWNNLTGWEQLTSRIQSFRAASWVHGASLSGPAVVPTLNLQVERQPPTVTTRLEREEGAGDGLKPAHQYPNVHLPSSHTLMGRICYRTWKFQGSPCRVRGKSKEVKVNNYLLLMYYI